MILGPVRVMGAGVVMAPCVVEVSRVLKKYILQVEYIYTYIVIVMQIIVGGKCKVNSEAPSKVCCSCMHIQLKMSKTF